MMRTIKFIFCSGFFFLCFINGESHSIRLQLIKQRPYLGIEEFRDNAELYRQLLNFFITSKMPSFISRGKKDKNVDYFAFIELGCSHRKQTTFLLDTSLSGFFARSEIEPKNSLVSDYQYFENDNDCIWLEEGMAVLRFIFYKKEDMLKEFCEISGTLMYPTMVFDKTRVPGVELLLATMGYNTCHDGDQTSPDGVFGLGFPSESLKMTPPFFTMLDRGVLDRPEFSLFIGKNDVAGELLFGGRNDQYYQAGSLHSHKLISKSNWMIKIKTIQFEGNDLCSVSCDAFIDTGTALIAAPRKSLKYIYKVLNLNYIGELEQVNCNSRAKMPLLNLTIDQQVISLTGYDYTIEILDECIIGIMESPKSNLWVLGNIFLSTVYTVFNVGEMEIGFAFLKKENQTIHQNATVQSMKKCAGSSCMSDHH